MAAMRCMSLHYADASGGHRRYSVYARGQNRARHSPSKTGVNALVAQAAKVEDAILPTPTESAHVFGTARQFVALHQFGSNSG
jgi:hypothetical protein